MTSPVIAFALLLAAATGGVRAEVCDGIPAVNAWPAAAAKATESWDEAAFAFDRLPWTYVADGARADRGKIFLLRASATVDLREGKYRLLLRSRSAARLTVAGKLAAELPFLKFGADGPSPVRRDVLPLGDTRQVAPGDSEKVVDFVAPGGPVAVTLELLVGGVRGKEAIRPELGESLVAVAPAGSDAFRLLAPGGGPALTDAGWHAYADARGRRIDRVEADRRAEARAKNADYWRGRRRAAAEAFGPGPAVPAASKTLPADNAVDHFLNAALETALAAKPAALGDFHRDVKPVLDAKCVKCHAGEKARGGYRLDVRPAGGAANGELLERITTADADKVMPPKGERLNAAEVAAVKAWVAAGAPWPEGAPFRVAKVSPEVPDAAFLRRAYLDVVGTVPTAAEARAFLADRDAAKRVKLIDRLLADPRWADAWVPYWQDVLAENPNIVNPTLNNSGPFRYWLRDVFADNLPWDAAVTDLVMLEGSPLGGGPAGFGLAAENDAPAAAKAAVLAAAFLGVEMKCARCHDAPHHRSAQADLFALAGMLDRKALSVPAGSTVPADKLSRKPLVKVSLSPGASVPAAWPLGYLAKEPAALPAGRDGDTRAKLAALVTSPHNARFPRVMANRVWRKYMGRGLVEPPHDWENAVPSHPDLLDYLAREFVRSGYDLKHLARLVLTSRAYRRESSGDAEAVRAGAAPAIRRVPPEALCDSLFDAAGRAYDVGDVTFDPDGHRPWRQGGNFGTPRRAWQFPYLSNDRDRPSLSLPHAQAVTDLLGAFGWDGNRQAPAADRAAGPALGQAAALANGVAAGWLHRLSDDATITDDCVTARSPAELAETLFLRVRSRMPTAREIDAFVDILTPGFADRVRPAAKAPAAPLVRRPYASWISHHTDDALRIRTKEADAARRGPAPTARLAPAWRERAEDCLWALFTSPEVAYVP